MLEYRITWFLYVSCTWFNFMFFIVSKSFFDMFVIFVLESYYLKTKSFYLFLIWMVFISFSFLMSLAMIFSSVLNRNNEHQCVCLCHIRGKAFKVYQQLTFRNTFITQWIYNNNHPFRVKLESKQLPCLGREIFLLQALALRLISSSWIFSFSCPPYPF